MSLNQPKSEFQNKLENMLQKNKQYFEDIELNQKNADDAAAASAKLFCEFINEMRYSSEVKAKILSGNENENTQILNQ